MILAVNANNQTDLALTEEELTTLQGSSVLHGHPSDSQSAPHFSLTRNGLFDQVAPFYYKERVRLTFSIADNFRPDFPLIRGLIEFNRSQDLVFNYDRRLRTVEVDVRVNQIEKLQSLLALVYDLLVSERQFRRNLRTAIDFENRYKRERERVYANLTASVQRR